MKQRIIIAGSRNFNNYPYLEYVVDRYFAKFVTDKQGVQIISGTAKGADSLGELYAEKHGIEVIRCPANWINMGEQPGTDEMKKWLFSLCPMVTREFYLLSGMV